MGVPTEIHEPLYAVRKPLGLVDRVEWLLQGCRNRDVLHVGCADYPLTSERVTDPDFLHRRVTEASATCIGVDLEDEAVSILRAAGFDNVRQANAEHLSTSFGADFDAIVAGEVIEHLPRPGLFFEEAAKVLRPGGRLLVTVPNAFNLMRLIQLLRGREMVHRDHCYYFSAKTLARLASMSGFSLEEVGYTDPLQFARYRPVLTELWRATLRRYPILGQSVVASFAMGDLEARNLVIR